MTMGRGACTFRQRDVTAAIREAQAAGKDIIELYPAGPNGPRIEFRGLTGPMVRPLHSYDRERAAAYCRCTETQFRAMVDGGFLPKAAGGKWRRSALDEALTRLDIRPTAASLDETYFIAMGDFIKIGFSGSAGARMAGLQTASPYDLKLLLAIPGGEECEQRIHELCRPWHHRGEWFQRTPALLAYIQWLRERKR